VDLNVHFKPLPMMTYYKSLGYRIEDFPVSLDSYSREISLPVYYDLTDDMAERVADVVMQALGV
jgi:dTDP-4-amino-4,6-dideoxygalactose transaminase